MRGPSDEYAVKFYVSHAMPIAVQIVINQAKEQLAEIPFLWKKISALTKLSFQNEEQAKQLLKQLIQFL